MQFTHDVGKRIKCTLVNLLKKSANRAEINLNYGIRLFKKLLYQFPTLRLLPIELMQGPTYLAAKKRCNFVDTPNTYDRTTRLNKQIVR